MKEEQCPHSTICLPASRRPRLVVIGAGFGGLKLIERLRGQPLQVVLIDKNNFHQFQPLLYQVAIAGLEPDSIVAPIRKLFQDYPNVVYRMAEVVRIEPESRRVFTNIGWVRYDYLVLATGSRTNFYGLEQLKAYSVGLKDIRDALDIRSWVLQNLEQASITCDRRQKDALTNFVLVGGGPAGVELAGALAEFRQYILHKDYPEISTEWMQIYLIEAADRLLPTFPREASGHALSVLQRLGVQVLLRTLVKDYDGTTIQLQGREALEAKFLVWTAGVEGAPPPGLLQSVRTKGNRLRVDAFNRVVGYHNIFAIGDLAAHITPEHPGGLPMVAPVAIQQGEWLGDHLPHYIQTGAFPAPFQYRDKGSMATIGKKNAVAHIGGKTWKGWFAWVLWSAVHLMSLVSFRNRLLVGINWMFHYLRYEKANRLIIRAFNPPRVPSNLELKKNTSHEMVLEAGKGEGH